MTTIVMNTLSGAVTEYDWAFDSVTATHAGDAGGLYLLGGNLDETLPIVGTIETGKTLWGQSVKKHVEMVYFSMVGSGNARMTVVGENDRYTYNFPVRDTGESRCQPGKGIRENYLAFGMTNPGGEAFTLDRIEVSVVQSDTRRVGS